jgi:hypothetical protein
MRQFERRSVRLERGVGPIPLVFHFKCVALKLNFDLRAARASIPERTEIQEGLTGGDLGWDPRLLRRPVHSFDRAGSASAQFNRMKHAKANPIFQKRTPRHPLHRKANRTIRRTLNHSRPTKMGGVVSVFGIKNNLERIRGSIELVDEELCRNRGPVGSANCNAYAANHLARSDANVAQLTLIEEQANGASL